MTTTLLLLAIYKSYLKISFKINSTFDVQPLDRVAAAFINSSRS